MINTGINYLSSIPKEASSKLVRQGIITTLKFPDTECFLEEMSQFLRDLPPKAQADIHGLINFNPAWNEPGIANDVRHILNEPLFKRTNAKRFSTHIGQFFEDGNAMQNFKENLAKVKRLFPGIRLGGENVFSLVDTTGKANYMTLQSSSAEFINLMWETLDFGVFDIAHAKIAAKDHGKLFLDYVQELNREKVEIIHISGYSLENITGNPNDTDLHQPCTLLDFMELRQILTLFPNVDLVISELACSKGTNQERIPIKVEDYVNEATALNIAVNGTDKELQAFFKRCK